MDGLDDANAGSSFALDGGVMVSISLSMSLQLLVDGASGDMLDSSIVMVV